MQIGGGRIYDTNIASGDYLWFMINNKTEGSAGHVLGLYSDGSNSSSIKLSLKGTTIVSGNVGIGTSTPAYQLQLSSNSAAKPSTTTWTIASDERLKSNIRTFNDGLSVILGINPVWYRYNGKGGVPDSETGKDNIGIVAQEMQKVAPYTIGKFKTKLNKEDTEDTELLDFNPHALFFVLINAIKEQQKEIDDLQSTVTQLQSKSK